MKKKILGAVLLMTVSTMAISDYRVYSKSKKHGDGAVISIPEQSCMADTSTLENGMYVVCDAGSSEVPVVNGVAFNVEPMRPADGFECANGYANHAAARGLASLLNVKVYTPYNSYLPVYRAGHQSWALGRASYVLADGSYENSANIMYSSYLVGAEYKYNRYKLGTTESLVPYENSGTYGQNYNTDYNSVVETLVASRACKI